METLASKLEETRLSVASTVKSESKRWQHYLGQRVQQVKTELASTLSLTALERTLLARVDASLVALDGRVRARLEALAKKKAPKRARPRKAPARATRAHTTALAA
jgi:hypothetical protein